MDKRARAVQPARSRREAGTARGAGRPTLVERMLEVFPLPYSVAAVVMAFVLGPPGSLLVAYLESGDLNASLHSYFHGYAPEYAWQQGLAVTLWFAFYAMLFWTIRHTRRSVARAREDLSDVVPDSASFDEAFSPLPRLVPALIAGLATFGLFFADYRLRITEALGPYSAAYEAISGPPLYLMVGTAIWVYGSSMWGVYHLGRKPLQLKPFYEDKTMGLRPLAKLSLSLAIGYFALLFIMVVMLLISPVRTEYVITLIAMVGLGQGLFYLPLLSAHRRMKHAKEALQTMLRARWNPVLTASMDSDVPVQLEADAILALEALERKLAAIRTWPFDPAIANRLAVMALTIILGLLTQVFKNLLGL